LSGLRAVDGDVGGQTLGEVREPLERGGKVTCQRGGQACALTGPRLEGVACVGEREVAAALVDDDDAQPGPARS